MPNPKRSSKRIPFKKAVRMTRWRKHHARVVVEQLLASGNSAHVFADLHGLKVERLQRWAVEVQYDTKVDPAAAQPPLQFAPVTVKPPKQVETTANSREDKFASGEIEVTVPTGLKVRVGPGFDPLAVKRLLEVVGC